MLDNSNVHQSKLFLLLGTLNKRELKQLELWLSSPIHNNSEGVLSLYQGLMKKHQKFDKPTDKLSLLKCIGVSTESPKTETTIAPQEEALLRQLMFKLTRQVESFLVWQHINEDSFTEKHHLMSVLMARKHYKLLPSLIAKTKKELEKSPHRDIRHFENAFLIAEIEYGLDVITNNRESQEKIQHLIADLRRSFLSKLLKYFCAAKNIEKIRKVEYNFPMLPFVKEHLSENPDKAIPIIYVYDNLLRLIEEGKTEHYYDLKKYLFDNLDTFDSIELRQFLNHMTNYCTRRIKEGAYEFIAEKHEIYQVGLELKCWTTGVIFSAHQFINIINNSLLMNNIEWAKKFTAEYKSQLNMEHKDDILNYSEALLHFHLKQFDKAHLYLSNINSPEDFTYHLNFKILLIKIYHELREISIDNADTHPINYELEAIRNHITSTRNKKMSEPLRQSYNNFIKIFKCILERHKKLIYRQEVSVKNIDKLREKLHNTSQITERLWLEEKIEELMEQVS